jgi:hypothetical protein
MELLLKARGARASQPTPTIATHRQQAEASAAEALLLLNLDAWTKQAASA